MAEEKSSTVIDSSDDEDINDAYQNARKLLPLSEIAGLLKNRADTIVIPRGNDDIKLKKMADQTITKFSSTMTKCTNTMKYIPLEQQNEIMKIILLIYSEAIGHYKQAQYEQCATCLNAFMEGMAEVVEL